MTRILCMAVMLCVSATTLFAQEEVVPLPLSAKLPIVGYISFIKPVLSCDCLKKETSSKKVKPKVKPIFSLDIPIASSWDTVEEDRIKNHTVQQGSSMPLWVKTSRSDKWPIPRIIFSTQNFRIETEGGVMKVLTPSPRTMAQVDMVMEKSIWFVLVGAGGFFSQEDFPEFSREVNFSADFRRLSVGRQGWLGIKLGDFNRNFIAGRYGRGNIYTDGSALFNVPGVDGLDWLPLYIEEFKTESLSVEGKAKTRWVSQSMQINRVEYKRVTPSPDPLRFGENRFEDLWLTSETEITPFPKVGILRGVIVLTKDFRDKNRLMFFNDYSAVRFFIRLVF